MMNLIYIVLLPVIYFSLFYLNKYQNNKFNSCMKKSNTDYANNARKNWKELRVNTGQCITINYDTKVDRKR